MKYQQVVEQFAADNIVQPEIQAVTVERLGRITALFGALNLSLVDDSGARLLDRVTLQIHPGETVAIVGTSASGAEYLAEALARGLPGPKAASSPSAITTSMNC